MDLNPENVVTLDKSFNVKPQFCVLQNVNNSSSARTQCDDDIKPKAHSPFQ